MSTNYTITQYDTRYDNVTGSGWRYSPLIPGTNVNGFIFANPTNVTFAAHIKNFIEPCAGAHYYAQTDYPSGYVVASMTVNLNEVEVYRGNSSIRNGYICLGIVTNGNQYKNADIGLRCMTDYTYGDKKIGKWTPYAWGPDYYNQNSDINFTWTTGSMNQTFTDLSTVKVTIEISVVGGGHKMECSFYEGNTLVAKCHVITSVNQMFDVTGSVPNVRFVRFMSLVPIETREEAGTKDNADGSYLKGAIRNLKLGNTTWDVNKIKFAWSVQDNNIVDLKLSNLNTTSIGTDADSIYLIHNVQTH